MPAATITPNLWFNGNAEEAASHYVSIFPNSRITGVHRFGQDPPSQVTFELNGQPYAAINGGDQVRFTPAVSFQVECEDQDEVDYFWEKLGAGGDENKRAAGWLVDKYGVSWQVSPKKLVEMTKGDDPEKAAKVAEAIIGMKKIDLKKLEAL